MVMSGPEAGVERESREVGTVSTGREGPDSIGEEERPESAQINDYLDEGYNAKQIVEMGFARGTVRREAVKRMKPAGTPGKGGTQAVVKVETKPLPAESLISELVLPEMKDGTKQVFDAGVMYGMRSILVGVKVAQELSKMAIDQASPLIKMAQEMRASEGKAAGEVAREAANEAAMGVAGYFEEKKPWLAASPDPMKALLVDMLRPVMENVIKQVTPGAAGEQSSPPGFTRRKASSQPSERSSPQEEGQP